MVFDGHLLCLNNRSEVSGWDVKRWEYAKGVGERFTRKGLVALATDDEKLWAVDGDTLYRWTAKGNEWEKLATFDTGKESVVAVVPVGGVAFVVCPSKVIDPVGKKTFIPPKDSGPFGNSPYDILATHATESVLWIGTSKGEWGGRLLGFDPKTKKWIEHEHTSCWVSGITHATKGEVIVSWATEHLRASSQVRVHNLDGEVNTKHDQVDDKYYRLLAYSPHDETLYNVVGEELVSIKDGKPTKVVNFKGEEIRNTSCPLEVSPEILAILPVGPKTVIVVPRNAEPRVVQKGEVTRLKRP